MIEQFSDWLTEKQGEIEHVSTLLSVQLSSEPADLIEDLTAIEAWNGRLNELLANCNAFLDRSKLFYLPEAKDLRESERKAIVDEKVADIRKTRDILEGYVDALKQRLILGESILRWERPNHTPEMKDPNAYLQRPKTAAEIMRNQ